MTPEIQCVILPRYELPEAFTRYGCKVVISIFEGAEYGCDHTPTPKGVIKSLHHRFYFDDLKEKDNVRFASAPTESDIANILNLYPNYLPHKEESRIFVHCYAGVSRSPAVALALYAKALGPGKEREAMILTEESAPYKGIWPNSLIVKHADKILDRKGALIQAHKDWEQQVLDKFADDGIIVL